MKGYPNTLNTKEDYEYVRTHFDKELWQKDFENLLDTVYDWFFVKNLEENEEGVEDFMHKVTEDTEHNVRTQYEYRQNPTAKIFRIGYTIEEVTAILAE